MEFLVIMKMDEGQSPPSVEDMPKYVALYEAKIAFKKISQFTVWLLVLMLFMKCMRLDNFSVLQSVLIYMLISMIMNAMTVWGAKRALNKNDAKVS